MMHKAWSSIEEVPYCCFFVTGHKIFCALKKFFVTDDDMVSIKCFHDRSDWSQNVCVVKKVFVTAVTTVTSHKMSVCWKRFMWPPWPPWPPWRVTNFPYCDRKCPHLITEVSGDDCDHRDRSKNLCVLKKVSVTAVTTVTGHKMSVCWKRFLWPPWPPWPPWPVTNFPYRDRKCPHLITEVSCEDCDHRDWSQNVCVLKKVSVTAVTTVTTVTSHKMSVCWKRFRWPLWPVTNFPYHDRKCPHLITEVSHGDCDHSDRSQNVCVLNKVSVTAVTTVTGHNMSVCWKSFCDGRDQSQTSRTMTESVRIWLLKCPMMTVTTVTGHKMSVYWKRFLWPPWPLWPVTNFPYRDRKWLKCPMTTVTTVTSHCDHRDHLAVTGHKMCACQNCGIVYMCNCNHFDICDWSQNGRVLWPVTSHKISPQNKLHRILALYAFFYSFLCSLTHIQTWKSATSFRKLFLTVSNDPKYW